MPPAPPAEPLWTRLARGLAEWGPVARLNAAVLQHRRVVATREFLGDVGARLHGILRPLVFVVRGLHRAARGAKGWWESGSKRRRRIESAAVLGAGALLALAPYGPVLLILAIVGWAGWLGRDSARRDADRETPAHISRLQAVYNGLVPYLHDEHDPDQHFKPGGGYRDAFTSWEFDEQDRLTAFTVDYSEYVKDGEAECRAKVERAIEGKVGRRNEFLYDWDEEGNHLAVRVLPPLPAGLAAQPWPVAEIEYVLGITDPDSAGRLIPVLLPEEPGGESVQLPPHLASRAAPPPAGWRTAAVGPVVWRVGSPCPHPHVLVTGPPGSGKTTVLRSLIGQALGRGQQVAVIDVERTEAYEDLVGRPGVHGVVGDVEPALQLLDWFGLECERRAEAKRAAAEALAQGDTGPIPAVRDTDGPQEGPGEGVGGPVGAAEGSEGYSPVAPLWLCLDGLPELLDAAERSGRPDLEDTLAALARKARYADVLVLATTGEDRVLQLRPALRAQLTVRIAMGSVEPEISTALFGGTLELGGSRRLPQGRGYVRIGDGPVIRLQTPYAPPGHLPPPAPQKQETQAPQPASPGGPGAETSDEAAALASSGS